MYKVMASRITPARPRLPPILSRPAHIGLGKRTGCAVVCPVAGRPLAFPAAGCSTALLDATPDNDALALQAVGLMPNSTLRVYTQTSSAGVH
jgi:hypothetical protein